MKFVKSYDSDNFNNYRYFIDGKRVSENEWYYREALARQRNECYNCASVKYRGKTNRYISTFYYD